MNRKLKRLNEDLSEHGHGDVVVAGLLDEEGELLQGDGGRDGLLPGLRGQAHRQVLLVGQQIRARLGGERGPIRHGVSKNLSHREESGKL